MTGCARPGSLGRHRLGDPDWAGRAACPCGAYRRFPPGTANLPTHPPTRVPAPDPFTWHHRRPLEDP